MKAFVPTNSLLITREVDGHGAGFCHVGLQRIAVAMGFGWGNKFLTRTFQPAHDDSGRNVGWLVEVF